MKTVKLEECVIVMNIRFLPEIAIKQSNPKCKGIEDFKNFQKLQKNESLM